MTLSDLTQLPDDALNVMLAELCGWKRECVTDEQSAFFGVPRTSTAWFPPDNREWEDLDCPRYTASLDACAEVRKEIAKRGLRIRFMAALRAAMPPMSDLEGVSDFDLIDANPRLQTIASISALTP